MVVLRPITRALARPCTTIARRGYGTAPSAPLTIDPPPTTKRHQPSWKESDFKPSTDPQLDGYPELPAESYQYRAAKGWDDVQDRRNIGEPVPEEYEALSMWTPDPPAMTSPGSALRQFSIAVLAFVAFGLTVKAITPEPPAVPRDYPYGGLVKELGGLEQNKASPESIEGED